MDLFSNLHRPGAEAFGSAPGLRDERRKKKRGTAGWTTCVVRGYFYVSRDFEAILKNRFLVQSL
jgi:hypothetical protein